MITDMEISILQRAVKNAGDALDAIETLLAKVYDEALAYDLNAQASHYRELSRRIKHKLLAEGVALKRRKRFQRARLWYAIHANTLLNTSTGHVARLMIRGNKRSIVEMMKTSHRDKRMETFANEIAEEFMDFEENNIEKLKKYL